LDRMFGISHALSIQFTAKLREKGKWPVLQLEEFETAREELAEEMHRFNDNSFRED